MGTRFSDLNCEYLIKSEGDRVATFTGIASTSDTDEQNDIIEAGAFEPIPMKMGPDGHSIPNVMMLRDHDRSEIVGGWRSFKQEGRRLLVEGELALEVGKARETYALLKRGYLSGLSVGFSVKNLKDMDYDQVTGKRTIKKALLRECSIVGFPANNRARVVNVKSMLDELLSGSDVDPTELLRELLVRKRDNRDDDFTRSLIKGIDGFKPIDETKVATDLRGLLDKMRGRRHD